MNSLRPALLLLLALAVFSTLTGKPVQAREVQVLPDWSVQVLDETGKPVAGLEVHEGWEFIGLFHHGDETRVTDAQGRAVFPARSFITPEAEYAKRHALSALNVHDSFGPYGTLRISPPGYKSGHSSYADGKIYDQDGAKTTKATSGFTTVFQFVRVDFFDFLNRRDWTGMKHLLAADPANAGLRDPQGSTPLIRLSMNRFSGPDEEMIRLLVEAGADIKAQAGDGTTALHNAAKNSDVEYMDLLLSKGADPTVKIHDSSYRMTNGFTPLHFVVSAYGLRGVVPADQKIKAIELLLAHGADINARDRTGASPLHLAAAYGDPDIVEALLVKGADPQAKNAAGLTPLAAMGELNHTPPIIRIRELLTNASAQKVGK